MVEYKYKRAISIMKTLIDDDKLFILVLMLPV